MKNRIFHILLILSMTLILVVFSVCQAISQKITELDHPDTLSDKVDTIEVNYIAWACPCANWLETKYADMENTEHYGTADECIFLEASESKFVIPYEYRCWYNGNTIRLIGSFYKDKGISRDYESPVGKKPDHAKVFRYTQIEVIKPYTVFTMKNGKETTKIIEEHMKSIFEQ